MGDKKLFFSEIRKHSRQHPFIKFLVVLSIFVIYLGFSVIGHGVGEGILLTILSWAFFVLCTPIADAGLLVDFPVRVLTGLRMVYSEIIVWTIAIGVNLYTFIFSRTTYENTLLLRLLEHIIYQPYPYAIIIILSAAGTFLSLYFGDEIIDIVTRKKSKRDKYGKHIKKYKMILLLFVIVFVIVIYYFLLKSLGLNIPLV